MQPTLEPRRSIVHRFFNVSGFECCRKRIQGQLATDHFVPSYSASLLGRSSSSGVLAHIPILHNTPVKEVPVAKSLLSLIYCRVWWLFRNRALSLRSPSYTRFSRERPGSWSWAPFEPGPACKAPRMDLLWFRFRNHVSYTY